MSHDVRRTCRLSLVCVLLSMKSWLCENERRLPGGLSRANAPRVFLEVPKCSIVHEYDVTVDGTVFKPAAIF